MGVFQDLVGQRFGRLTVVRLLEKASRVAGTKTATKWLCVCDCGGTTEARAGSLKRGDKVSCGCFQKEQASKASLHDLTGQKFGRLLVLSRAPSVDGVTRWCCVCDCGNETRTRAYLLVTGVSESCGCYNKEVASERALTHGMSNSAEYEAWQGIKSRCYSDKDDSYPRYGGRGIRVCERWLESFDNFYADMGPRPSPDHSVERDDVNGDYDPENCYWATPIEQANNKTTSRIIEYLGRTQTLTQWCRELDVHFSVVWRRISVCGWSVDRAFTEPAAPFKEKSKFLLKQSD